MVMLLLGIFGCTTLSTVQGAKVIEPKTWRVGLASSVQDNNPLSTAFSFPVPQTEVLVRYGLNPHMDLGSRIYLGGILFDLRYQFWQQGDWYFAIDPSVGGLYSPVAGIIDFRLPIVAQKDLSPRWSIATGLTPISRNTYVFATDMRENMKHNSMGTFLRFERSGKKYILGCSADIYERTSQGAPPSINFGVDISRK